MRNTSTGTATIVSPVRLKTSLGVLFDAAQFAAKSSLLENFITETSRKVAQRSPAVVINSRAALLQVGADSLIAKPNQLVLFV